MVNSGDSCDSWSELAAMLEEVDGNARNGRQVMH